LLRLQRRDPAGGHAPMDAEVLQSEAAIHLDAVRVIGPHRISADADAADTTNIASAMATVEALGMLFIGSSPD
jgi:hypothetical protein